MRSLQELVNSDDAAYLIPSYIYERVAEAAKMKLVGRNLCAMVLGPADIPGSDVYIPIESARPTIKEVGEGAELWTGETTYTRRTLTPKKYGDFVAITTEVEEDAKFRMIDLQLQSIGYKMAEKEDYEIWNSAYTNAGNTVNAGVSVSPDDLVDAMTKLEAAYFKPTDLIVSPTVAGDLRKYDTFVEADKVGNREMFENGFIGKMYGMNTYISPNVNQSTTYDAFVIDRSNAMVLGEKRPLTVKEQDDVHRDRKVYGLSMRIGATYIHANSICRIYSS